MMKRRTCKRTMDGRIRERDFRKRGIGLPGKEEVDKLIVMGVEGSGNQKRMDHNHSVR